MLVILASMMTGMLACWIGSGTQNFYSQVSAKFSGANAMLSGNPSGISREMVERYRNR